MHQGADMEARNKVRNMVKLFVERSVLLSGLATLLVLATPKYQPQDVEEQSSGSNQKILLATVASRESTHSQTSNKSKQRILIT